MSMFVYLPYPPAGSGADYEFAACLIFQHAKRIAKGGRRAAREWAKGWLEHSGSPDYRDATFWERRAAISRLAQDARDAAAAIVKDGRPLWIRKDGTDRPMVMVASLFRDRRSSSVGYSAYMRIPPPAVALAA